MSVQELNELLKNTFFEAKEEQGQLTVYVRGRMAGHVFPVELRTSTKKWHDDFATEGCLKKYFKKLQKMNLIQFCPEKGRFLKPDKHTIHHNLPLCFGGDNSVDNLRLASDEVHKKLHRKVWDPLWIALQRYGPSRKIFIAMPQTPEILKSVEMFTDEKTALEAIAAEKAGGRSCVENKPKIEKTEQDEKRETRIKEWQERRMVLQNKRDEHRCEVTKREKKRVDKHHANVEFLNKARQNVVCLFKE